MSKKFWEVGYSRRTLFGQGGMLAAMYAFGGSVKRAVAAPLQWGTNMYQSIGVRPVINARGTFTIISGSMTLPEVKKAMEEASRHHVHMDELMESVGNRLAEITGAEYGIVTAGCCAALTHFTAACIAGSNPERMQKLPSLEGLKNEVIIPAYSRNDYDHAIRMLGAKIITVRDKAEMEAAFNERTAMVYILAGNGDEGPLGTAAISEVAKKKGVPVIVDAAAEILTVKPNVHLQRGATAVAYSGGKCIRGPQAAGLLLGEKSLVQAAWINSAPHHAFGRSLKVGKEEIMGMMAAVEMWIKRDHQAEWKRWEDWLNQIATRAKQVPGVTAAIAQPGAGLSNRTPQLNISWDGAKLGITGTELNETVLNTEPRIVLSRGSGTRGGNMASSIGIVPYMMAEENVKVVADRIHALLSNPPKFPDPAPATTAAPAPVAGQWDVRIEFTRGTVTHTVVLEQDAGRLTGTHFGEFDKGDLTGTVAGNAIRFNSGLQGLGRRVTFGFSGAAENGKMSGTVDLGEYGAGKWTAERHPYRGGRGGRG
jgi:L-seryl-tRNA(Ser) seleniumtransferase